MSFPDGRLMRMLKQEEYRTAQLVRGELAKDKVVVPKGLKGTETKQLEAFAKLNGIEVHLIKKTGRYT